MVKEHGCLKNKKTHTTFNPKSSFSLCVPSGSTHTVEFHHYSDRHYQTYTADETMRLWCSVTIMRNREAVITSLILWNTGCLVGSQMVLPFGKVSVYVTAPSPQTHTHPPSQSRDRCCTAHMKRVSQGAVREGRVILSVCPALVHSWGVADGHLLTGQLGQTCFCFCFCICLIVVCMLWSCVCVKLYVVNIWCTVYHNQYISISVY